MGGKFEALPKSIIGKFKSIIGSSLDCTQVVSLATTVSYQTHTLYDMY